MSALCLLLSVMGKLKKTFTYQKKYKLNKTNLEKFPLILTKVSQNRIGQTIVIL
jgi:hypothetical protein